MQRRKYNPDAVSKAKETCELSPNRTDLKRSLRYGEAEEAEFKHRSIEL